jgi:hypothetical protein
MENKHANRSFLLEDALNELIEMESTLATLQNDSVFQSFTSQQKAEYHDALGRLRDLIRDLEEGVALEKMAS